MLLFFLKLSGKFLLRIITIIFYERKTTEWKLHDRSCRLQQFRYYCRRHHDPTKQVLYVYYKYPLLLILGPKIVCSSTRHICPVKNMKRVCTILSIIRMHAAYTIILYKSFIFRVEFDSMCIAKILNFRKWVLLFGHSSSTCR